MGRPGCKRPSSVGKCLWTCLDRTGGAAGQPRFVIDLADRIGGPSVLKRLRAQLLTMDDRQATSWLLKGRLGWWCCRCSGAWPCCDGTPAFGLCFPPLALRYWTVLVRPQGVEPLPQAVEQAGSLR